MYAVEEQSPPEVELELERHLGSSKHSSKASQKVFDVVLV